MLSPATDWTTVEDNDPAAPWMNDPLYGGMKPANARRSWEAEQDRQAADDFENAGQAYGDDELEPPPPAGPQDYGLPREDAQEPGGEPPSRLFEPVPIDAVEIGHEPQCLVEGILPARGLAGIVGAPKSGKSFFLSDMLFFVARGVPYGGRAVRQGPVVYLTGEGVQGFRRRLVAMRRHYEAEGAGVPFFMVPNVPDLGSPQTNLPAMLAQLDDYLQSNGIPTPAAIALDTVARCMGEGDENSARDMGRFISRCGEIERHYGCLVAVIHHVGKDPTKGARGSNALNGAMDVTLTVEKADGANTVSVTEMKDGPEGQEWRFRLLPYELDRNISGPAETPSDVSTCVVELLSEPSRAKQIETKSRKMPRGVAGDLLKVIRRAVDEAGETNTDSGAVPPNVRAVSRGNLKRYCKAMDWQDPDGKPDAFRAALSRNLSTLRASGLIGFTQDWLWLA